MQQPQSMQQLTMQQSDLGLNAGEYGSLSTQAHEFVPGGALGVATQQAIGGTQGGQVMVSRNGAVFAVAAEESGHYEDPQTAKYEGYGQGVVGGMYSGMEGDGRAEKGGPRQVRGGWGGRGVSMRRPRDLFHLTPKYLPPNPSPPSQTSFPTDAHFSSQSTDKVSSGWDWAQGSTTIPAPPKRTLHSLGVPDSLWRHFQR